MPGYIDELHKLKVDEIRLRDDNSSFIVERRFSQLLAWPIILFLWQYSTGPSFFSLLLSGSNLNTTYFHHAEFKPISDNVNAAFMTLLYNSRYLSWYRCVECQDDLCESCGLAHKKTKLTRNHVLAPFEQIQLGKYDLDIRSKQQVNCNIHSTELCSSFCVTCNQLYCENCDKDHDKHTILKNVEFSSLNDKDRRGSSMSCLIDTINDRLPFYKSYLQFLTGYQERLKQNREEAVEAINKRAELLHQLIEKQKVCLWLESLF